jgi:hypothetical protein
MLVRSIRFHADRSDRLQRIRVSAVSSPGDLWTHLILRINSVAGDWCPLSMFFSLYCDISDERGFIRPPEDQFREDLADLMKHQFVEVSGPNSTLCYRRHSLSGVPERIKITSVGMAHVRDANEERRRAGM